MDGAQAPIISSRMSRGRRLASERLHHGTFFSSGDPPQLLQVGLDPDEHIAAAWNLSLAMGPGGFDVFFLDHDMPQDTDLTCSATNTATHRGSLAQRRSESIRPVRTLPARLWPTTLHQQKAMHPAGPQSFQRFPRCLLGSCDPLYLWSDCLLPMRCVAGFSNYGLLERSRVLRPVSPQAFLSQENFLKDAANVMELLVSKVPPNPTSFLAVCSEKDIDRGGASDVFAKDELDQTYGKRTLAGQN